MKCGASLFFLILFSIGCVSKKSSNLAVGDRVSPTYDGPSETAFCSTSTAYSPCVTVTVTAKYIRREPWGNHASGGLGSASTSGTHPATEHPIRQAEVRVTDPAGNVVQCAATNNSGVASFALPQGNTSYTVRVNSRAYNSVLRASILNQPEKNQFYSLSQNVTATGNSSINLTAGASGDVLGGAFNILDQILNARNYLASEVSNCSGTFAGSCRNVNTSDPLPKVTAYWTKGYNPNSYFGGTSGLSFYLPGYSRLFILGGLNGDVDNYDTDHFDNSVIIHEYGHFLEDTVGASDSPGGSHSGNSLIDPRLAWSEGWGNFFQAAVRNYDGQANAEYYIDTLGNDDGGTDMAFFVNLETASAAPVYDDPAFQGEGNFREFAVTRLLWDAVDTNADTDNAATDGVSGAFNEIWNAFSNGSKGFAFSNYAFRNIGLLHLIQSTYPQNSWTTIRNVNLHDANTREYGQYVTTSGTCGSSNTGGSGATYYYSMTPTSTSSGNFSATNLLRNNDFFWIKPITGGPHTISIQYEDADHAGQKADIDLYVYKDEYTYGASSDWLGYSRSNPNLSNPAVVEGESTTVTLTAGANYMLNVFVWTGNGPGTTAYYNIYYDGVLLCPATIVP